MINTELLEQAFLAAQEAVQKQGDTVRSLKASLKDGKVERVRATRARGSIVPPCPCRQCC